MKEFAPPSATSLERDVIGKDDPEYRKYFDFHLQKQWIDSIVDELEDQLVLFFRVYSGIKRLHNSELRNNLKIQIEELMKSDAGVEDIVQKLEEIFANCSFENVEVPDNCYHILESIRTLRNMLPIKEEVLQPYIYKQSEKSKLQYITGILVSKGKINNLRRKVQATQKAIDEMKMETFLLKERSPREIQDIIDESELELIALRQSGDRSFAHLQEEVSRKVLDLENSKEYRALVDEHNQKRRKITKLTVQLQLWIKQYDKFVGEPMKELEALENDVAQFPEWKETVYDPQQEQLEQLTFNVEVLEAELIEEQVEKFRIAHAARVLQRAWRQVLVKKAAKKKRKGKKGKGKGKKKK
ncbi:uncharacterized protein LOC120424153 [Culex pipiens pallens]|nr:uncharacterized protein LOC120424153 [Culex pipiens pallens]